VKAADANRLLRVFSGARLALAGLLLTLGPFLPAGLVPGPNAGMLALALLVAVASSAGVLFAGPLAAPRRMAWFLITLDVVLVTAVVAATGGPQSIFSFLYVLSVVGACVLLSRAGGLAVAGLASALYIGLVYGRTVLPITTFIEAPGETTALEVLTMFCNTGTLLIVAIVAGNLAERYRETHQALESERRSAGDLEAFKNLVFNSVGTGLIAIDLHHDVTAWNPAAAEITGIPAVEAIGRSWRALFGDAVALDMVDAEVQRNGRMSARHEMTLRRSDDSLVQVGMTFSMLSSGEGERLGLIAACQDLSVIRAMEARMRHADRLATLGRMSANIAHEIRNPLASLTGAVEALVTDGVEEDRERLSQIVLRESDRLNGIIRNFLQYARPAPLSLRDADIADVLDEITLLLERGLPAAVKLVRQYPATLSWRLDTEQFRQALWNLCRNAIDAMPRGGDLLVGASVDNDALAVWVGDTGIGIPATDIGQIFEPFYSTKAGGTGLGLALVHRVVADHGGQVDVKSEPGFGTTFGLRFPRRA
jgi:two-component system sensor histidine kinase PilS (NtrC family)